MPGWSRSRACENGLTPANQLTLLRMLLIPAFVILVVYGHFGWALVVFATAGVTDALDGLIARRSGQKTSLGAWLDPMADKLLLVTTFIVLTLPSLNLANRLPIWLTMLIISRDVGDRPDGRDCQSGDRTRGRSCRQMFGKVATATYIVTAVVAMLFNYLGYHSPLVVDACVWASLAITLVSALHYIWHARRIIEAPLEERVLGRWVLRAGCWCRVPGAGCLCRGLVIWVLGAACVHNQVAPEAGGGRNHRPGRSSSIWRLMPRRIRPRTS